MQKKLLPNILTLSRIAMIPILVAAFYIEGKTAHWVAAGIFIFASITDFFDGYLARSFKVQSRIGTFLDPIADKLLVVTAIVMLVHFNRAHIIPSLAILCREILVSGLREFLAGINVSVPVSKLAKIKTGVQFGAILVLILGFDDPASITMIIGNIALWVAAGLTIFTGYSYLKSGIKHMDDSTNE